ncbi:uncharacterized protein F4807DRAFT_441927 [Annulohypoxylon truncatum]|uniref:uncharacterized protein n=1 Tax=Annulohypoxylon truncatum TaxID=327061 RepID=UPI00200825AB|nr:uncharacterized protein F4807DRAFT_441927 [Annulohypoxylon truncatum]KAI1205688.1 hypothetical protein F4807DRAFT_441927 [Annulohypoxylon truncatum]
MAQVSIPKEPVAIASGYHPGGQNGSLTPADLEEIREYQKVISFRDTIVSGKHPRIKVAAKSSTPAQQAQATSTSLATDRVAPSSSLTQPQALQNLHAPNLNSHQVDNLNSFKVNSQQSAVAATAAGAPGASGASGASSTFIPGVSTPLDHKTAIQNFKTKTWYLERQRQKLEQELAEQVQLRPALISSSEHIDLDLADVLAKAITVVQATAPMSIDTPNAATISDSNDSFDDNTFYSSSLETPGSRASPASPRVQKVTSQDAPGQDNVTPQRRQNAAPPVRPLPSQSEQPTQAASSSRQLPPSTGIPPQPTQGPESSLVAQFHQLHSIEPQVISSDSGPASRSDNGNTDSDQPGDFRTRLAGLLPPPLMHQQHQGPLVRAHDLSPYAPQPAHISSLATARVPPTSDPEISILPGAPAQVTALRQERGAVTSPESSPQGEKRSKKKNNKKNKRKAEPRVSDVPGSPYIKPEPRSPSPLSAPQFARPPQKRLRSGSHHQPELVYDEPRIQRPVSVLRREQFSTVHAPIDRSPYGFERVDDPYARQLHHSVAPASQRLERAVYEERRADGAAVQYVQRVQSPYDYATPYSVVESRPLRSASYSLNPQYREFSTYPRDGRMSARPYADRARSRSPIIIERRSPAMAPPAPPPRIIVDQYGREYIEPPRASTVSRHSVVPAPRPAEREIIYERVPARVPSRMSRETFEEDAILYRRSSPAYAPRRVFTQPEYGVDYRSYRERDYPTQPIGAPGQEFAPIRGAIGGRAPEDMSRDYLPRATTVRPAEAVPYYHRPGTIRPDIPPRQYAASVNPEVRRDVVPPVAREFSVRPVERDAHRREYSVRPVDRLYNRPLHADEDVTFIENPQAAQPEIIYTENSRRQPY